MADRPPSRASRVSSSSGTLASKMRVIEKLKAEKAQQEQVAFETSANL